jgi:hypothetical protein
LSGKLGVHESVFAVVYRETDSVSTGTKVSDANKDDIFVEVEVGFSIANTSEPRNDAEGCVVSRYIPEFF